MPSRRTRLTALLVALLAVTSLASCADGSGAAAPTERFLPGQPYVGTFADPSVLLVGDRFVAAATTTANLNLPVMTSTDLVTWRPRPPLADYARYVDWRKYNDAMPLKSRWALTVAWRDRVGVMSTWAPSLARVGGDYVAAYSAAVRLSPRHSCIGIARAASALGPYRDTRREPLLCFPRAPLGAIDPDVFVHPRSGRPFLLWKQEGIPGVQPPKLMVRPLGHRGAAFAPGSRKRPLLVPRRPWEAGTVENPSMVHHGGRLYLFYSGNDWQSADYATGYAVCATVRGPCRRPRRTPLLTSAGDAAGPGGADAVVDRRGRLRLLYHAWDADRQGQVREGALRRLHVATLEQRPDGRLRLVDHGG